MVSITPTWNVASAHVSHGKFPDLVATDLRPLILMAGKEDRAVFWNGRQFETAKVDYSEAPEIGVWYFRAASTDVHERQMLHYYPIDPRMTRSDVDGAIRAYPNADNTGWIFKHTDEGTHHDYELRLISAVDGVIQPYFRQLLVDQFSTQETVRQAAADRFVTLSRFYGEVVVAARAIARSAYLGEREQKAHPREGWLDHDITAAVAQVRAKWSEDASTDDNNRVAPALVYITQSLTMPSVETRWDRAARLEAEAKKKAAEEAAAAESESSGSESEGA